MLKKLPINMRVEQSQRDLLTKAAKILNIDRSSFILDVACREAEHVLLDQRFFHLNEDQFNAFENALTAPIPDSTKLQALLAEPSPWDK